MLKCKMFNLFASGSLLDESAVNEWLRHQSEDIMIVSVTQSSAPGSAIGLGEGVRTTLTIIYR